MHGFARVTTDRVSRLSQPCEPRPQPGIRKKYGPQIAQVVAVMVVLSLLASLVEAAGPAVVPIDGPSTPAQLVAADAAWQLTFTSGGKPRTMPAADLVRWGTPAEPARAPILVLADGGLLPADVVGIDKEQLAAESDLLGPLKIPLESLAGILFHPPAGRPQTDRLLGRIVRAGGDADRLILDNGDEVTGLVAGLENDTLRIATDVGPTDVALRRIVAVLFTPTAKKPPVRRDFRAWAGLSDGSRLLVTKLLMVGKSLEMTGVGGRTWHAAAGELVSLQPLGGRAVYLSDLRPTRYRHVPYLNLSWPYYNDRNVTGGLLRCGGRLYLKGLGVHSAARLGYALDGSYRRFQAELGIDDSTGGRGSVKFRILVDGRQRWASGPIRGGAPPVPVSVDVSAGKRLDLVVDFGERGDELDHADWLDARLVK
jgi:hypothetical protein